MSSTFSVDAVSATFDVTETSFNDKGTPTEELACKIIVYDDTQWGALFSLRSWNLNVRPIPKRVGVASKVLLQVGGGAGEGTLSIDATDTWANRTAILTDLSSDPSEADGGRRLAAATFTLTD